MEKGRKSFWGLMIFIGLSLAILLFIKDGFEWFSDSGRKEMHRIYGSNEAIEVVKNPDRVLLYSVKFTDDYHDLETAKLVGPIELPANTAKAISKEFSNPAIYYVPPQEITACAPIWGIKVVFQKGARQVSSLYCQWCTKLAIDPTGKKSLTEIDKGEWILAGSQALEEAAKKYFPKNDELRQMKKWESGE